jgi:hypothetical protein
MANAGQAGGAQPPPPLLAYASAAQFNALWDAAVTDQARKALEQEALTRSPIQDVQFAAMLKVNLRLEATVGQLAGQVTAAQAAAQAAGNVDRFRPAAPPKYGNKKQSGHVRQWTPVIEDYLCTAPDADYIRLASSYLEGGSRSLWTTVYEAYKAARNEPPNPRQYFREALEANYGLQDSGPELLGHLEQFEARSLSGHCRVQRRVPAAPHGPSRTCHRRADQD